MAEKQHSLKVLEAAMLEAKEAKSRARQRERNRFRAEKEVEKATDELDAKLRDDERYVEINDKKVKLSYQLVSRPRFLENVTFIKY